MRGKLLSGSLEIGAIVAAATGGALVAIGGRLGSASLPFAAIASGLTRETVTVLARGALFGGVALHLLASVIWSALFLTLVRRGRGAIESALVVTIASFVWSWLVAKITGGGLASLLPLGDRLVVAAVLWVALVVGMRLAFSAPERLTHD